MGKNPLVLFELVSMHVVVIVLKRIFLDSFLRSLTLIKPTAGPNVDAEQVDLFMSALKKAKGWCHNRFF